MARSPADIGPIEGQDVAIAILSNPASHGGVTVTRIDTHGAIIFLAGKFAWKLKRAIQFAYMDFSTRARRLKMLMRELRLNCRTAPGIYLGLTIVEAGGAVREISADGFEFIPEGGEPVLVMRQFDESTLFDNLAEHGRLNAGLMARLAEHVAAFHRAAEPRRGDDGAAQFETVVRDTFVELDLWPELFTGQKVAQLRESAREAFNAVAPALDERARAGRRVEGHGDLHLANICLWPDAETGAPTLFDALEFSERLATVDVYYDLAFLIMDLCHRDLAGLAAVVLSRYVEVSGDADLSCLPLFLCERAMIRAHVSASMAEVAPDEAHREVLLSAARAYFLEAEQFLQPASAQLIAIGGYSGTGKSSLARLLAPRCGPAPGAVMLRSDGIRKALFEAAEADRLGPDAYSGEVSARVYDRLIEDAHTLLQAGHSVVLDATFLRADGRERCRLLAESMDVPFTGLWLEAETSVLEARIAGRQDDASDADIAVLHGQLRAEVGPIDWLRLDAAQPSGVLADKVTALLVR